MKLYLISVIKLLLTSISILNNLHLVSGHANVQKAMTIPFVDLYNLQPLNCTSYIPPKVISLITAYSANVPANSDGSYDQMIPAQYLLKCLLNSDYEERISPFYFMQNATLNIGFGLNELLSLSFEGVLTSAITITMQWVEPRLTWNKSSDIPHWNWPTKVDISPAKIWLPVYFIHNCPDESCTIYIDNNTELDILNDGTISAMIMTVVQSTCHLKLDLFPFDEQSCKIVFDLDNSIPFSFDILTSNIGTVLYYEEGDGWLVTSLNFTRVESGLSYEFKMNTSSTDWIVSTNSLEANYVLVQLTLVRTSASDVYDLLAPVYTRIILTFDNFLN